MSKQTATEYLIQEIKNDSLVQAKSTQEWNEVFKKAKQMEREQIVEAFKIGSDKGYDCALDYITHEECDEQNYYNETYGGQDESK
jgi:hypothetical protein